MIYWQEAFEWLRGDIRRQEARRRRRRATWRVRWEPVKTRYMIDETINVHMDKNIFGVTWAN